MNLYTYNQMIFNMGAKTTLWGKNCSLTNAAGKIGYSSSMWIATCKIIKLDPYFIAYAKINLKWIQT